MSLSKSVRAEDINISSFSIFAKNAIQIGQNAKAISGNIGTQGAGSEITIGERANLYDGVSIYGDSVTIGEKASVDAVYYNKLTNNGKIRGKKVTPLTVPLNIGFPEFPDPAQVIII